MNVSTWRIPVDGEMVEIDVPDGWILVNDEVHRIDSSARTLLSDLDRCEHGRHFGDVCGGERGCNGPSKGNPFIRPGQRIGSTLSAHPIVVPWFDIRTDLGKAELWLPG